MQTELIIVSEYCHKCHIEPSFIEMLEEGGLINVHTEGGEHYLLLSELPNVERYSRMYYDLSINMEGIDAIHHMDGRYEARNAFASQTTFAVPGTGNRRYGLVKNRASV